MARKKNTELKIEKPIQPSLNEVNENIMVVNKGKRGRKPKNQVLLNNPVINNSELNTTINDKEQNVIVEISDTLNEKLQGDNVDENDEQIKTTGKKRGRKPKGGKIIQQIISNTNVKESKPNIILHLKCSMKDLQNNLIENNINGYDFTSYKKELLYEIITNNDNTNSNQNIVNQKQSSEEITIKNDYCDDDYCENDTFTCKKNDQKDLWKKLKNLEYSLHLNNISDKKSACFWCTYEFDNPPIYIPKHFIKESYQVYGCFCSPECATSHLMEENIDSSTKFERYHLLNHIYSKIYGYTKNIKPAPNPYYILEKFYGNLNIQEYRSLLKNERLFLVVDKPLTRILPELHEDNDDFIINNKIIPSNTYQIKRKMLNKQSKNNILSEKFGLH
jgi:hypothetical protein